MFTKKNIPHNKGKIQDIKKLCNCTDFEILADKKINICNNSKHTISLIPRKFFNINNRNKIYYRVKTKFINCIACNQIKEVKNAQKFCSYKCQNDKARIDFIDSVENGLNDGLLDCNIGRISAHYHTHFKEIHFKDLYINKITPCCKTPILDDWIDEDGNVAIMEINHIDHNHKNNKLSNLEYICANCHRARTLAPVEMKKLNIKGRSRTKYQDLIFNYS